MKLRIYSTLTCLLLILISFARAETLDIKLSYLQAQSFDRISHYLGHDCSYNEPAILRSNPQILDGWYFIIPEKLQKRKIHRIEIQWLDTKNSEFQTKSFIYSNNDKKEILLGLTHLNAATKILTWEIIFFDANNKVIKAGESFLWRRP